jgi:hypothetical protein
MTSLEKKTRPSASAVHFGAADYFVSWEFVKLIKYCVPRTGHYL